MDSDDEYDIPVSIESPDAEGVPPEVDEAALRRMQAVADLMDEAVEIPGTGIKVGLDPLLGVIPGAGDAVSAGISLYIVLEAANLGVPYDVVVKMLGNVAIDTAGGSVPVLGTIFDTFWKANTWNVRMVEEALGVDLGDFDVEADDELGLDSDTDDDDDGGIVIDVDD
ncbi:DUF4112 domain-containing protein [Halomarina litorea]|uniref:DUF4112 domain-containing protein n=1 Tax=Halomarina litorea TaxID=2961595 RepID=UPI0020C3AA7D|nr:DUF4112 domain-containing protein [Halomarina sp. BCD28]